ncbi:hypothetical protein [Paremcibacter congregatus]
MGVLLARVGYAILGLSEKDQNFIISLIEVMGDHLRRSEREESENI